jgi:hypothetical protein
VERHAEDAVRAIMAWFGTVLGKVVAIFLAVLIVILVWKWQSIYDAARTKWWGQKMDSANVHAANADTALRAANVDSSRAVVVTREFGALTNSPEVRRSPIATRVAASANTVIATKNSEIGHLRTTVAEKTKEVADVRAAGEKPVPRISPYADIGYARSFTRHYGVPVVRAGVDYRVVAWAHVQTELSYEPPPAPRVGFDLPKDAEIRGTITAHIVFR